MRMEEFVGNMASFIPVRKLCGIVQCSKNFFLNCWYAGFYGLAYSLSLVSGI